MIVGRFEYIGPKSESNFQVSTDCRGEFNFSLLKMSQFSSDGKIVKDIPTDLHP